MRISYKWLLDYLDIKTTPEKIAEKLTSVGLEVESIEYEGKKFDNFVVGEVLNVEKHPNANKLSLCKVKVSSDPERITNIVCGAPNVTTGQKVAVALIGAVVPHNQHDPTGKPFVIGEAIIRGQKSFGMICSSSELGIGDDTSGILVLSEKSIVGQSLASYFGVDDVALEIGVTPNRPDCLNHLGIAREVAAAYNVMLKFPKVEFKDIPVEKFENNFSIEIENIIGCPRYVARLINNISVKQSPEWLQKYLTTAGIRPINNIVDVTNFVMLEYGQPLHAFDYSKLNGNKIVVKNSGEGEKFKTLDSKEYILTGAEVMICDGEKSIAIGGVMGGLNSEISDSTTSVLLEAAYFQPQSIRRTSKRFGLNTDASFRFERGIDPNATNDASRRAALLIAELSGGVVVLDYIDVYPKQIKSKIIDLRISRLNAILGTNIQISMAKKLLESINIATTEKENVVLQCSIPTYRPDIEQEIDLVEEVARLFGYDNIEDKISSEISFEQINKSLSRFNTIRTWFESNGFNEVITNSLVDEKTAKEFSKKYIKVLNPLSQELDTMRPTLLPTMLQSVLHNNNHGIKDVRLFEIGRVFETVQTNESNYVEGFVEKTNIGICISGNITKNSWYEKQKQTDIYDLKGVVQSLLKRIGLDNIHLICYDEPTSLTEETIGIEINTTYVGFIGKCRKEILQHLKIEHDVYFAELNVGEILKVEVEKKFNRFSKFPTVSRDLAFIVDKDITIGEIEKVIKKIGNSFLQDVTLFDIFEQQSLGEEKKSVAFAFTFSSAERTLKDEEIDSSIKEIISVVQQKFNATLRAL